MKRRLYFLLPDLPCARQIVDDLLLARVEARRIHVLARRGTYLDDLPEANVLQKTDLVHAAQLGLLFGGLVGALGGIILVWLGSSDMRTAPVLVLVLALAGALFGFWAASMVGAGVPNSRLRRFRQAIEDGRILLMVDVPYARQDRVIALIHARHPEAVDSGTEPTIPAFP